MEAVLVAGKVQRECWWKRRKYDSMPMGAKQRRKRDGLETGGSRRWKGHFNKACVVVLRT